MIDTHSATATYGDETLEVVGGSLTLDRTRVPYAQGTLTVKGGYDIDPRLDERVRLSMSQTFSDGDTLLEIDAFLGGADLDTIDASIWNGMSLDQIDASLAVPYDLQPYRPGTFQASNLSVRSTSYDAVQNETTVSLSSDEGFAQDYKSMLPYSLGFGTNVRTTVQQALRYIGATLAPGVLTFTLEEAPVWEPGESLWDFLQPLASAAGLLLYSDNNRTWYLVDPAAGQPGTVTLSGDTTIVGAVSSIDREGDEWADGVVVIYTWTTEAGASFTRYDIAGVPHPTKVVTIDYPRTRYPGPGAAAAILNRLGRRGRQVPVEAVNDYTAKPGMAVSIAVQKLGDVQQGGVKAVQWGLADAEWRMNLDAYDLEFVLSDSIDAFPDYVMIDDLLGMISSLKPGDY